MRNQALQDICNSILQQRLGDALGALENYILMHQTEATESFNKISTDYRLMAEYWQKGYDDPMRSQLYHSLLQQLYVVVGNLDILHRIKINALIRTTYERPRQLRQDWSASTIRMELESFVSDVALLELEPEHKRIKESERIYEEHQVLMSNLFDYILTAPLWTEGLADTYQDILLAPTIDSIDQQLLLSAMMLSCMETFDFQKFRVLLNVYRLSQDEYIRQRALVGWVLCADSEMSVLYEDMVKLVKDVCEDDSLCNELTELQMQLFYCMDAEEDTRRIQKEIMPDLINGNNLKMTSRGLVEMDEDTLDEILHPDAAEQNMERMEKSMHRMMDMQKQGSDIYFGGFSQMKRFPFFNEIGNWFIPYYSKHPAVRKAMDKVRGRKILEAITNMGAFCDSDKYSFVLAYNQVLDRMPQSMMDLIDKSEADPIPVGGEIGIEERKSPAFIRRMYLQNLYRFYRVYPARSEFRNPFNADKKHSDILIFANPLFNHTRLQYRYLEIVGFMMKRKMYSEAMLVMQNGDDITKDFSYYMTMGRLWQVPLFNDNSKAYDCYYQALQLEPESEKAKASAARCLFKNEEYEQSLKLFSLLLVQYPEKRSYQLNAAICHTQMGQYEDALKILYKLEYEYPDDIAILRVFAWTQTLSGKYDQAQKIYARLLQKDTTPLPEDLLNDAFCLWFSRDIQGAIALFRQYVGQEKSGRHQLETEFFVNEYQLLRERGIDDTEIRLMLEAAI